MSITKGKWEAVENMYYVDVMCNDVAIATAHSNEFNNISKEQMRANARMMADSKEMFDYLSHMVEHEMINDHSVEREVKALLAKVKGDL